MRKHVFLAAKILSVVAVFAATIFYSPLAKAQFNANDLIDDGQFDNTGTMTAANIDAFLNNNFGSTSCISTSHGFTAPDVVGYTPSGSFMYGSDVSAGTIIYNAAQVYGVNPQVLLTTLEKEQSLVSGAAGCNTLGYVGAMGNGCPDGGTTYSYSGFELYSINGTPVNSVSGTCVNSAGKAGFSRQVITGAWLLKFSEQRSKGNVGWNVQLTNFPYQGDVWDNSDDPPSYYGGYMTQGVWARYSGGPTTYYDGTATIDSTSVYMTDGATASLYTYTPHFHGNEMFDDIFNSWFGLSVGEGYTLATSYDDNGDTRQWVVYQGARHLVPDVSTLKAWGLDKITLVQWSGTYLGSFPTGSNLTRLMRPDGSQDVYFVDNANCYKITSPAMLAAWGFNSSAIDDVSLYLSQLPTNQGNLTYAVRENGDTSGAVYMVDGGILRQYSSGPVLFAWEGDNAGTTTISSDYFNAMGGPEPGGVSVIGSNQVTDGTQAYEVVSGQKLPETSTVAQLYPGPALTVSAATLNRLFTSSNASQFIQIAGTTQVYMVDKSTAYPVADSNVLRAWGVGASPSVNIVDNGNYNLLTAGSTLNTYEADVAGQLYIMDGRKITVPASLDSTYRTASDVFSASPALMSLAPSGGTASNFIQAFNNTAIYLMDNTSLRLIMSPDDLALWNNGGPITQVSSYVLNQFTSGGPASSYVTDGTTNYLMEGSQKHVVSSQQATNWKLSNPNTISSATLSNFPTGLALGDQFQYNGHYYFISQGTAYMTIDPNIAAVWGIGGGSPALNSAAVDEYEQLGMMTRFAKSNVSGDTRLFVADNGTLYYLSPDQAANLGLKSGMPLEAVNPESITPSISPWTASLVQDASGKEYVIDGGTKRYFPNSQVESYWTNNGALAATATTNGFLNLLPTSGDIEREITGSTPPQYAVQDGQKQWIQSTSTAALYAPLLKVSDSLINVLPSGSNLP